MEKQERALRQMRRGDPETPLVKLLDLDPGEEFSIYVSKTGKLEGEQLDAFRKAVNGGLAMNGHYPAGDPRIRLPSRRATPSARISGSRRATPSASSRACGQWIRLVFDSA